MSETPIATGLLTRVGRRLQFQAYVQTVVRLCLLLCGLHLLALLVSRGTGWGREIFPVWSMAVPVLLAFVAAAVWYRRPDQQTAARAVDRAAGTRDLFLTLSQIRSSAGAYQVLVLEDAERRAASLSAGSIVPIAWHRDDWSVVGAPAILLLAILFVPQFDPFGSVATAALSSERQQRLVESRAATQLRLAEVRKPDEETPESKLTETAIDRMKLALNKMQPREQQLNFERLMDEQRQLGEVWKQLADERLQNLLRAESRSRQMFGAAAEDDMMRKWVQQLQSGSTAGLKQEMQELKDKLQQLAKTKDPIEKEQLQREMKERLERLDQLARKQLDDPALSAALQRAMSQLDLSRLDELTGDALQGALESLELSELELDQLADAAADLKRLEEALKSLQMAKKLNEFEKLDGAECQQCSSLSDYEKLFREKLAACQGGQCQGQCQGEGCAACAGNGNGRGMGGPGIGRGGRAPEDDSVENDFQTEISKSAITAGKMLMSTKTRGMGDPGQAQIDYRSLLQQVKQGASEAIRQEQVPPGYHDGIKRYFDQLQPQTEILAPAPATP